MNTKILFPKQKSTRAILYTVDALLAAVLLLGGLLILLNSSSEELHVEQKIFLAQDVGAMLSELTVGELNNSFIASEIANKNITRLNNTILAQMGEYWADNKTSKAQELLNSTLSSLPFTQGIRVTLGTDELYFKNISTAGAIREKYATSRMVSGISKDSPLVGSSASAYLQKIHNKKDSSYIYFGGFVGQGDITTHLALPTDFTPARLVSSELKIQTPGTFTLQINNVVCADTFTGNASLVQVWNITSCSAAFTAGNNNITLRFSSSLNESYIAGGFIKATYFTDVLYQNVTSGHKQYTFPEIYGLINLYDSISAQGLITSISFNISFNNTYDTFLTLGNQTIFVAPGKNISQNVVITLTNQTLPPTQIPLRLGMSNFSNITQIQTGLPSDSFLVTDVSGSMASCGIYENETQTYCSYQYKVWFWWFTTSCIYPGTCAADECGTGASQRRSYLVYNETSETCSQTKLEIAQDADNLFVDIILNSSTLNKVGLVDFSTSAHTPTNLTNVKATLASVINGYTANGGTCTCCGINRARMLVNSSINKRFIVVLSDGDPTYYCKNFTDYSGSTVWAGDNTGGSSESRDREWAINASNYSCQQNITVFSIGFGSAMSEEGQEVMRQIACNSSYYYNAADASQLSMIYQNISEQILLLANFSSQTVEVQGNFTPSALLEGSSIDIYFTPIQVDAQNVISLNFESDDFSSCTAEVFIPAGVTVSDAYLASYSGNKWTKSVRIRNSLHDIEVYNLSMYGFVYTLLGDPFQVQIPSALIVPGEDNTFILDIGDSPSNSSNCSTDNSLIYTAYVSSSTPRTDIYQSATGCMWTVESESGTMSIVPIPRTYAGNLACAYTSTSINYSSVDAYDVAAHLLFLVLDPDRNGKIFVDLGLSDLEVTLTIIQGIPYLWGPSIARIEVWQ